MSIKTYNEVTGQWEVRGTNQANVVEIEDVTGELGTEDVEGALTNLIDMIEEVDEDLYEVKKQVARTDDKVNSLLEEFHYHLDNHPSGGGDGVMPTITSTQEGDILVDKGATVTVPIFYSSGNLGDGTAYILVNNVEMGSQTVKQGSNKIEFGVMPNQANTISVYVKDRGGLLSNQLTWTVICGGIEVTTTFDWEADYPMGEDIRMPFTIDTQSEEPIIMYLTIDQDIVMVNCQKGYNEYVFLGLGVGVHRISFYVESGKYKTDTYSYNMVVVDSNNLYVSTTFTSGQEISFGALISINYRVSKASTENFTINLYLDGVLEKTQTAPAGSYYWTITRLPIGYHTFKIEATGVQGDYSFVETDVTIIEGVFTPIEPVSGGLLAYFNAKNKSNQDDNKEIWEDLSGNGVVAKLYNFNYGNNGWMGDYLQCSGDSYVEIDMQPYLDNVRQGSTIDIHFNMTSVGIDEARVLDYTELEKPYKGIYIDTLETKLVSETSTGLVKLDEDTDTRLTYVIDRQNRLAIIYLNGVINRVFQLSDTGSGVNATFEDFSHKEKIYLNSRKGQDLFADCKIYSLRVYGRALSHEEVLQNHIADIDDLEEQEKAFNRNYANTEIPEIRMYGDTSNMTGEIFQTMRIKYVSPNEELYGQSFDTMYNQVRWQGTSSQQYDMKNYQVYLRDNNMADMYYTPFPNGIPEHIYTFKCNYMESSHMNNTGIATFANDCVFTTPNPAQAKNPLVRNSINGFPCLMYINDELEGVYTFNLDRYSTNSLGYDTTQFPRCLSYEISANSDTGAGAFVPWTSATGKTEREYIASDFRCRFPDNRVNGDDDFAELKRLIDWVGNATDDMFREQIDQYFNLEYLIRYYLTVMCFGLVDNLGKNTMLTTFDGNVWYMQLYDCDSSTGLDNSGAMKFDPDIEVEVGVFNTSNSRLWEKLRNNFPSQILAQWEMLRLSYFTEENIMNYLNEKISNKIPEINYNLDAWKKYISMGTEFLFACHGNRKHQITRWIRERLIYMDTLLGYTVSTNDYVTIRANKLGEVYLDIQVFQPMYFSVKFRNEENNTGVITKRISRGETVRFSYNLPVATDQEILVYGGRFIKDLGDLTNMNPTNLLLGNATRLTRVKCNDSPMLINASISNCTMLQEVDLRGCSNLGAGSDASLQTLDLSQCRNLRTVDIYGTQLTALYTSQVGGIIQEIVYPYSIQIVQVQNQARLTSLGIPCYYTGDYNDERNIFAERLSLMQVANCPNVKTFVKNYHTNEDGSEVPIPTFIGVSKGRTFNLSNVMGHLTQIDLSYCSNIESLTLDNFYNLTEINFDDIAPYNATTSNLYNLTLTNCPNVETLTFNQNTVDGENSLGVAFKEGTVLDLSGLYNLKHIRSNVGVKGLKKLILPLTISSLVFNYPTSIAYAFGESDIEDIFSKNALHETDGFKGIDLLGIETITDFSMGSLTKINNAINLDVKITDTFPYINYFKTNNYFKPEGIIDISEYKGSLEYLFKGVDLDKLTVVCNQPLPHTSAKYMFAFASGENVETLNTLFSYMPNVTDFSYMFYNGYLKHAPLIPLRAENVSYMFYNNLTMETTPSNWLQEYPTTLNSSYCYTGCANIHTIDDTEGSIDIIPSSWGGYDRVNIAVSGETISVDKTIEREFVRFVASGQTFQNIVPEVGQTPTLIANKSEQLVGEGMSTNILLVDGKMPEAELQGFTLVNLASEKRSSEMTCNQTKNNIRAGLNDAFLIEDGGVVSQLELDGLTLVNIMPKTGKTPVVNNNDRTYKINKGLNEGIIIGDGKMLSSTLYGETVKNLIDGKNNKTPLLTLDAVNSMKKITTIETELYEDYEKNIKIQDGGEIKSAILKGQTEINRNDTPNTVYEGLNIQEIKYIDIKANIQPNSTYTVFMRVTKNTSQQIGVWGFFVDGATFTGTNTSVSFVQIDGSTQQFGYTGWLKVKIKTKNYDDNRYRNHITIGVHSDLGECNYSFTDVMILDGDKTNITSPPIYFEGMQSVKMPVLTTTGKNLFDGKLENGYINNGVNVNWSNYKRSVNFIKINPKLRYTISKNPSHLGGTFSIVQYDCDKQFISTSYIGSTANSQAFIFDERANYIKIACGNDDKFQIEFIQVEEGSTATSYEPYKSNILTANEEVELRGIGDVKDELNLLTGELTQRIGEVVLDGSSDEDWYTTDGGSDTHTRFVMRRGSNLKPIYYVNKKAFLCSKFKCVTSISGINSNEICLMETYDNYFVSIIINNTKLNSVDVDGFKLWLQSNPVKINYVIEDESIKTVVLKCTNQDDELIDKCYVFANGHISVSSDALIPTLEYLLSTTNYYELNSLQSKTNYTLRFDGEATSGMLGGSTINAINDALIVTSVTENSLYLDGDVSNVMLLEGNYIERDIPYFTGMRSVEAIEVETSNSDSSIQSTIQLPPHIQLHSLPNGTRDEVDIKTGILTRRVGYIVLDGSEKWEIREFNTTNTEYAIFTIEIDDKLNNWYYNCDKFNYTDIDIIKANNIEGIYTGGKPYSFFINVSKTKASTVEEFKNWLSNNNVKVQYTIEPTTEQLILNYNNSCDYGRILPTGMCDKYDVVNSMYTQTMTSILLDGANTWNAIQEFENTVKFAATATTVGVENLNMLGAGGLYCDNDLFPNINDDSDMEHCRVDEEGNKFYIYISKDRLMSPDLIGYQIWLQANKFNMTYELAEHITYSKPYEELDPTQARWEGMDCMRDGAIRYRANNSDNITLYPTLEYIAPSINNFEVPMLEPNTEYTIYAEGINEGDTINFGGTDVEFANATVFTSGDNQWLRVDNNDSLYNMVITKGDTTGEHVPYFEGMASVKMPVLTTVGKNLFNSTFIRGNRLNETGAINQQMSYMTTADYINIKNVDSAMASIGDGYRISQFFLYDDNGNFISKNGNPLTNTANATKCHITIAKNPATEVTDEDLSEVLKTFQLEQGSVATSFEPYKSNILTVNEDVTLRGIGDVKDELNCLTGEVTERIGEVVLDGSEDWKQWWHLSKTVGFMLIIGVSGLNRTNSIANSLTFGNINGGEDANDIEGYNFSGDKILIRLNKTKLNGEFTDNSDEQLVAFKNYLSQNPITIQYQLATESIKTVDLKCINQAGEVIDNLCAFENGTINISSDIGLLPTVHYTVPSTNTFHLPSIKTGTRYTLKYPSASGSITIGDINYSISSDSMLFTTPLKINGDTSAFIFSDNNPENVVLLEGVYNTREVPHFIGVKSVKNPNITIVDQLSTESNTYRCAKDIELRGLPNGVADSLDIVRGKLTTVVGVRDYQEGDEELDNVWTDGYETVYALSSPIVTNVEFETPYVTANSLIALSSDNLIPQLNYRAPSSNNFLLDLLQPNQTYTLYADTLVIGTYILGGTHISTHTGAHTITLGDVTEKLLTFNGDLGLSNVMLIKGNSLKSTLPKYFSGLKSVTNANFLVEGYAGETNELSMDEGIVLRDCNGVKDSIDLITCTLTKRTGEITLNGSEGWSIRTGQSIDEQFISFRITLLGIDSSDGSKALLCDTLNHKYLNDSLHNIETIYSTRNTLIICVKKSRIGGDTVNAFKSWLNQNPTTVVYPLTTPLEVPLENVWTTLPPTSYDNQTEISSTVSTNSLKPMINVTIATTTLEEIVSQLEQQNAELQAQNESLEQENVATMLALTDLYEALVTPMVAMSLDSDPYAISTMSLDDEELATSVVGYTVSPMGTIYAKLIHKGLKTIDQVPYFLQQEVRYALKQM